MNTDEANTSAWVHFFNQAVSNLTVQTESYTPDVTTLVETAENIADAAVNKLNGRDIPEEFWPTASKRPV